MGPGEVHLTDRWHPGAVFTRIEPAVPVLSQGADDVSDCHKVFRQTLDFNKSNADQV
jgi:hypothetical protein